ncbi:MAG: biotin/lipoyl-binding protein [Ignavibacteria bacterium]|nr:biotin/lipoyl-binding protein [Ignavibacteria bacterium]
MNTYVVNTEIDGKDRSVELTEDGSAVSGSTNVYLAPTDVPNIWHWIDGSMRVPVHIVSNGMSGVTVTIRGYSYSTSVLNGHHHDLLDILKASPAQKQRVTRIPAPMPGLLKAVHTTEGAQVRKGETLFTLEAMKMENAIKTPISGTVRQLTTNAGSAFEKGTLLCVIEPLAL